MLLAGTYDRALDGKNRLAIPAKLRDLLRQQEPDLRGLYVTPGQDRCLGLYTRGQIDNIAEQLAKTPFTKDKVRNFRRLLFAQAAVCEFDTQGRVLIPERLVNWADLHKEVVLAGVQDHMEVWDRQRWNTFLAENEGKFDLFAEGVFDELL